MRIAFTAQRLAGQRLGVGRYIEYMIRYWTTMLHETDEMTVSLRRALEPEALESLELSNQVTTMLLPPDVSGIPWENLSLGPSGMDVLFCPPYTAPLTLRKTPYVVGTRSVNEMQAGAFVIR